jgi:hypothetical protein
MMLELTKLKKTTTELKKIRHWPSRPLPILPELKEFGVGIPTSTRHSVEVPSKSNSVALSNENRVVQVPTL